MSNLFSVAKEDAFMSFTELLQSLTGKPLVDCTDQELYLALQMSNLFSARCI